jgi:Putative homoserine kinase type II (protein kinase fold)
MPMCLAEFGVTMMTMNTNLTPFSALTPDIILNALDSVGLHSDGRLLALNSYENRVYQVGMIDASFIVTKFYRPERWSSAAILEEHAFVQELFASEIPVVPAILFGDKQTLIFADGFRFSVFPRQGGRVPELQGREKLEWMGRFIARIHAIGALMPFKARPTLDIAGFGDEPRAYLLANNFIPVDLLEAYRSVTEHALASVRRCFERAGKLKTCVSTATVTPAIFYGPTTVHISLISTTAEWVLRYKIYGCCCPGIAPK